jgi:hypothetical protein
MCQRSSRSTMIAQHRQSTGREQAYHQIQCGLYLLTKLSRKQAFGCWKIFPKSPRIPKRQATYCTRTCTKPLVTLILEQVKSCIRPVHVHLLGRCSRGVKFHCTRIRTARRWHGQTGPDMTGSPEDPQHP